MSQKNTQSPQVIDASNCPSRMVYDDATRDIGTVLGHVRRSFVRERKIAYIWRPPKSIQDEFTQQAIEKIYTPMVHSLMPWFIKRDRNRVGRQFDIGNSLCMQKLMQDGAIIPEYCEFRIETIILSNLMSPFLRAASSSMRKGQVSDINFVCGLSDGYGEHRVLERPIHIDALRKLTSNLWKARKIMDVRAVVVDQGEGTRVYDLTADQLEKPYNDGYGLKQELVRRHPFLIVKNGDVLFIESGERLEENGLIHEPSESGSISIYQAIEEIERLRFVRTYDISLPLNKEDRVRENRYLKSLRFG